MGLLMTTTYIGMAVCLPHAALYSSLSVIPRVSHSTGQTFASNARTEAEKKRAMKRWCHSFKWLILLLYALAMASFVTFMMINNNRVVKISSTTATTTLETSARDGLEARVAAGGRLVHRAVHHRATHPDKREHEGWTQQAYLYCGAAAGSEAILSAADVRRTLENYLKGPDGRFNERATFAEFEDRLVEACNAELPPSQSRSGMPRKTVLSQFTHERARRQYDAAVAAQLDAEEDSLDARHRSHGPRCQSRCTSTSTSDRRPRPLPPSTASSRRRRRRRRPRRRRRRRRRRRARRRRRRQTRSRTRRRRTWATTARAGRRS